MSLIEIRALRKEYRRLRGGRVRALDELELDVTEGGVFGFLGPNGAGKTTTMRVLVGLIRPDAGVVELFGKPYDWSQRQILHRVGALIEEPAFYPYLSGRDNLRVMARYRGLGDEEVTAVLDRVDLVTRGDDRFRTYSLGMKQRLGVAAALLSDPDLLILDEPANGLDPGGMVALRETLRWLTSQGKTVLISSHLLSEVEQLADVVGIIDRGVLLREGPMADLVRDTGQVRVRVAVEEMPGAATIIRRMAPDKQLYGVDSGPRAGWFQVTLDPVRAGELNRALAEAGIFASGLEAGSDLETFFLQVTAAGAPPAA